MIDSILEWNKSHPDERITISVELETRSKKTIVLVEHADFVFIGKDYSELMGWNTKEMTVESIRKYVKLG